MRYSHLIVLCGLAVGFAVQAAEFEGNKNLLPNEFKVYYKENTSISDIPFEGATEKTLPTHNTYSGTPGCYVTCYSRKEKQSIYPLNNHTYVMGQLRLPGQYNGAQCQPTGFENRDLSGLGRFKDMCEKEFPTQCAHSSCWASGETGQWFKTTDQ